MAFPAIASAFTVVIDPGHGGKDVGTREKYALEKNINLDVALRLGKLLECCDNVRVVYTRTTDKAVDLQQRAACANEIKADLFVSIHCNSMGRNTPGRERPHGTVTYVLGPEAFEENLEVAHRENSVISLEEDFTSRYQSFDINSPESHIIFEINQRRYMHNSLLLAEEIQRQMVTVAGRNDAGVHQAGFIVLAQAAMPAVLIELDFISNPNSAKFLASNQGANSVACAIRDAILKYRENIKK